MLIFVILTLSVAIPVVMHWRSFDIAESSARSALLYGLGCGLIVFWKENWGVGLLSFFVGAFLEFAIAYVVGLVYQTLGCDDRRTHAEMRKAVPISIRRELIGGLGALAIPLTVLAVGVAYWWQMGSWPSIPLKPLLGLCASFVLGLLVLIGFYWRKRSRNEKSQ